MANPEFFKSAFDDLSVDGRIGDPRGQLGYCYLRVSTAGQAEEGRSGLPRQIKRIHEVAIKHGITIPWELVFADDHTGFEFRDRPELSRLRQEYQSSNRRANVIVIEYLDRLSRNADWHQGFLLDEMNQHKVQVVFWKGFSSRIERAVMGAIAQDGMERELQNMHQGMLDKARSGRVTSKTPNYGYRFVDAEGKESPKVKKETYYALHSEHAPIIESMYHKIAQGWTSRAVAAYLQARVPPPGKYKFWEAKQIVRFVRNSVYKGEFVSHRWERTKGPAKWLRPGEPVKLVGQHVERPQDEWIVVPVPAIVSVELWETANYMLDKNAQTARRNGKLAYLLTGLIKCAECGYSYTGKRQNYYLKDGGITVVRYYRCSGQNNKALAHSQQIGCTQKTIKADLIEQAVWLCVCQTLLEPELLLVELDKELNSGENASLAKQIAFLQQQIRELGTEDEKLYRAYMADVFDEQEYAARRNHLKDRKIVLEDELRKLRALQVSKEEIEADKEMMLEIARQMKTSGVALDAPFELKKRIIQMVVDCVIVNVVKQSFELQGQIRGTFFFDADGVIVSLPAAMKELAMLSRSVMGLPVFGRGIGWRAAVLPRCAIWRRSGSTKFQSQHWRINTGLSSRSPVRLRGLITVVCKQASGLP